MGGGGGGGGGQKATQTTPVSYKKEVDSSTQRIGSNRKALGSIYLQQRTATPMSGGFGGQKQTLG